MLSGAGTTSDFCIHLAFMWVSGDPSSSPHLRHSALTVALSPQFKYSFKNNTHFSFLKFMGTSYQVKIVTQLVLDKITK